MDVEQHVRARAKQLTAVYPGHSQPWLMDLIGNQRFLTDVCEAVTNRGRLEPMARSVDAFTRLKANAEVREFRLVPFEADVTMARQSRELVRALEDIRRPISRSSPAIFKGGEWSLEPFNRQRRRGHAHHEHMSAERALKRDRPYVALTDVRHYFPSLTYRLVIDKIAELTGVPERDVAGALDLHGRIWHHSRLADAMGMPVGCEVSSAVGVALLSALDDLIINRVGESLAVRWMDDVAFGVDSQLQGRLLLGEIQRLSLDPLGLRAHPRKTAVVESEKYVPRDSYGDAAESEHAANRSDQEISHKDLGRALDRPPGALMTRDESRPLLRAASALGDDALVAIASRADLLLAGNDSQIVRTLRGSEAAIPGELSDLALKSLLRNVDPGSPHDGEASQFLLHMIDAAQITATGKRYLREIAEDSSWQQRTRAVATWLLAKNDDFPGSAILDIQGMTPSAARAMLAAAIRSDVPLASDDWAAGSLAA